MDHTLTARLTRRATLAVLPAAALGGAGGAVAAEPASGTISIEQTSVGFILGASWGNGTLTPFFRRAGLYVAGVVP